MALRLKERIGLTSTSFEEEMRQSDLFFQRFLRYAKNHGASDALSALKVFLNEASLYGIEFEEEEKSKKTDSISLLTLHASKGLEFPYVFIIGVNQGLLPLSTAEKDLEEEQRLFFVGMTRAQKYLELSYYGSSAYPGVLSGPSRFLHMIRSELVEEPLITGKDAKEAAVHLQKMKRMILMERQNRLESKEAANRQMVIQKEQEKSVRTDFKNTETEIESDKDVNPNRKGKDLAIRIHHDKYGDGYLVKEDDTMLYFTFDDYGEKEMLKMFTNFTRIGK